MKPEWERSERILAVEAQSVEGYQEQVIDQDESQTRLFPIRPCEQNLYPFPECEEHYETSKHWWIWHTPAPHEPDQA